MLSFLRKNRFFRETLKRKIKASWFAFPELISYFWVSLFRTKVNILLYLKWITNRDLRYRTWTLLNVTWQSGLEGAWVSMDTCMCMADSLSSSPETTTTLLISYTPIQNKKFKVWKKKKEKNEDNNSHSHCINNILNFRMPSSYEATSFCIFILKILCKSAKLAYLQSKKLMRCYCIELKSSPWES